MYCQLNLDNFCYFCTAVSLQEAIHRSAQICRRSEETSALLVAFTRYAMEEEMVDLVAEPLSLAQSV